MIDLTKKYKFATNTNYTIFKIEILKRKDNPQVLCIFSRNKDTGDEFISQYNEEYALKYVIVPVSEYKVVYSLVYNNLKKSQNTSDFNKLNKVEGSYIVAFIFKDGKLFEIKLVTSPVNMENYHE